MTWKELKDFCNSLDEKQLERNVILWREDEAINNIEAEKLPEDRYICPDACDEGCYPLSEASEPLEDLKKVYEKGDAILWEKF
jgi:hypothetical protein